MSSKMQLCRVRSDLVLSELSVPLGNGEYFGGVTPLPYRWKNLDQDDEQFQVYIKGSWQDALSIDFEFEPFIEGQQEEK